MPTLIPRAAARSVRVISWCVWAQWRNSRDAMPWKRAWAALALAPAQPLREVDEFVFEQPLQRVQPVAAGQTADRNLRIAGREAVKEDGSGHGDLETDDAIRALHARRLPARARHPAGKAERHPVWPEQFPAEPVQETCVVGVEQKREIVGMKAREMGFAGVGRRAEETLPDIARPTPALDRTRIVRQQNACE